MVKDYFVYVCDNCLTASCWHGEFMCEKSDIAGIKKMKVSELIKLDLEHCDNYSEDKLMKVYEDIEYV